MSLILHPDTEARIQRELARGFYSDPTELLAHALDLVEAEQANPSQSAMEDWLTQNKDAVRQSLEESFAAAARGESYSAEEVRAHFAARRAARSQQLA